MTVKQSYIEIIEKYNGTLRNLWIQPFFITILKNYFRLLDDAEYDAAVISEESYIKMVLESNKLRQETKTILSTNTPIKYVQEAIEQMVKVGSIYESLSI